MAEQAGMDSATVSDHFQPWRHDGGHAPFSLAWLTAVGERTSTIQLGTSVLTPTFRYNPAVLAQAFATMACLYPGRVFLGVGTGEALNEIATGHQGEWPEFKERFARLRESVRLMRELWTGATTSFSGDFYSTKDAFLYEKALENCRFWAPLSLTPEQKHSVDSPREMERLADELPIEQVAKRWIVASDPDDAVEQVKQYVDAGLNHLVFHAPGHDQKRFLDLFKADLEPRLRALV